MTLSELMMMSVRPVIRGLVRMIIEWELRGIQRDLRHIEKERRNGFAADRFLQLRRANLMLELQDIRKAPK